MEGEVRERRGDDAAKLSAAVHGGDEVEHDVLRTRHMLQHGEHASEGDAEVGHVIAMWITESLSHAVATFSSIAECQHLVERWKLVGRRKMRIHNSEKQHHHTLVSVRVLGACSRLEGKVALITGAASGIGEETVRLFAEHGALIVATDIQDEQGHRVAASIGSERVTYHHCDVRDENQVEETINFTLEKHGRIDVLFSNAGVIGSLSGILDLDLNEFDNTMATNVRGVAATIKHTARAMVAKSTRGSIICTTSVAATIGGTGPHGYTTSKHALLGLVKSACSELGAYGIRVNSISPFGVATPLACKAFNFEPEQVEANSCSQANLKGVVLKARHIAEAALFLASDDAAVYISGHNLVVDGGFSVVNRSYSFTPA
ncbi:hypothetical protein JHK82_054369 [Glycine max]|nr:hypothetical protein JHK86_054215 [Glycine max]KAG5086972.1 hypothetical protein JHK82_054369 [Glycine max]